MGLRELRLRHVTLVVVAVGIVACSDGEADMACDEFVDLPASEQERLALSVFDGLVDERGTAIDDWHARWWEQDLVQRTVATCDFGRVATVAEAVGFAEADLVPVLDAETGHAIDSGESGPRRDSTENDSPREESAPPVLDIGFEYADNQGYTFEARLELLNFDDVSSSIEQAPPGHVDIRFRAGYRLVVANTTEGREAPFRWASVRVFAGESPGQDDCSNNRGPRDPEGAPNEPRGPDPRFCHLLVRFPQDSPGGSIPPGGEVVLEQLNVARTIQVSESNEEATLALHNLEDALSGVSVEIRYSSLAQPTESEFYFDRDGSLIANCATGISCSLDPMDPTNFRD